MLRIKEKIKKKTLLLSGRESKVLLGAALCFIAYLTAVCVVLLWQAATAKPVQALEVSTLNPSEYPSLGLVIVEAALNTWTDTPSGSSFPNHDFAFSQTLMATKTAYGSVSRSQAFLVRPKAPEIYSSEAHSLSYLTGVDKAQTQGGTIIIATHGQEVQWRVSSFPLPFAFHVSGQKVLPSDIVECCQAKLCAPNHGSDCFDDWQWQDCATQQDGVSLTLNTCNSEVSNFSWPSGNFFLVPAPLPSLEHMRHQVEAAIMSWNQSLNDNHAISEEVRGAILYQGDELSRLSDKLESAVPAGTWVNLTTASKIEFAPSWCKGAGCSSEELKIKASISSAAATFAGYEDASGFNWCENQKFAAQGSAYSRMVFNPTAHILDGYLPYTFTDAIANIMSYGHTGWSIVSFLFPTVISLPFLFSYGSRYSVYKDALQELGNARMEAETTQETGDLEQSLTENRS